MPLQDKGRIAIGPILFGLLVFGGVPLFLLLRTISLGRSPHRARA